MGLLEDLSGSFRLLNIKIDQNVLDKCIELCTGYNVDAEDFVDQWFAFTVNHLNGAAPNIHGLEEFERKDLQKVSLPKVNVIKPEVTTPKRVRTELETEARTTPKTPKIEDLQRAAFHTPSKLYQERNDASSIVLEYGTKTADSFTQRATSLDLNVLFSEEADWKFMYEKLTTRREVLNRLTHRVAERILNRNQLNEGSDSNLSFGDVLVYGRIYSGANQLNLDNIELEGTIEFNRGRRIELRLSNLPSFSIFSGQVAVVKGSITKMKLYAKELYTAAPLPLAAEPFNLEPLQIMVAAGPFTLMDNLLYEPLYDLIAKVQEAKPNLLILLGPFIDKKHSLLNTLIQQSFEEFFEELVETVMSRLEGSGTHVVLIPSSQDVFGDCIFPTAPYSLTRSYNNLTLAPNPCQMYVNGLLIGACSADVLFHLGPREFSVDKLGGGQDRMTRLAAFLVDQGNFCSIADAGGSERVDFQRFEQSGQFSETPHLLVVPSNFRYLIKNYNGTVIVNPERLAKGHIAGTYAKIELGPEPGPTAKRICCQILRI